MHDCIFNAHCIELFCDKSCPALTESTYLLERNNLKFNNKVFQASISDIDSATDILEQSKGSVGVKIVKDGSTNDVADLLTYCSICQNWQGSRLHCNVYNLRFSKYLEDLKKSWNSRSDSEDLEYVQIWSRSAKVLIISNIDYVDFGDFQSQTLLNLLQERQSSEFTTIIVSPPLDLLVSTRSSIFFSRLIKQLSEYLSRR